MEIKAIALGGISTEYFITDNGKTVMIDAGCYLNEAGYAFQLMVNGVDPTKIDYVVLTHGHFDHAGNLDVIRKLAPNAKIIAHAGAVGFIKNGSFDKYVARVSGGELSEAFTNFAAGALVHTPYTDVDVDIMVDSTGLDLHEFGVNAKVVYTPGHTFDSISVMYDSGEVFVGDSVVDGFTDGTVRFAHICCAGEDNLRATAEKYLESGKVFYSGHPTTVGEPFTYEQVKEAAEELKK